MSCEHYLEGTIDNHPIAYLYDDEEGISYLLTPSKLINGGQLVNSVNEHQVAPIANLQERRNIILVC